MIHTCHLSPSRMLSSGPAVTDNNSTSKQSVVSMPPLPVRIALVGSSVGLASPFFALGGVGYMWFQYLPKTAAGTAVKYLVSVIVGGGVVKFIYEYVGPFLWNNSDFVLPFAAANGLSAAFWYTAGEAVFGAELLSGSITAGSGWHGILSRFGGAQLASMFTTIPTAGPVIGMLTAVTAPFLWPVLFQYCWSADYQHMILGSDPSWISNMYEWIALPVGVPVGALSGVVMHLLLKPAVYGSGGGGAGGGGGGKKQQVPWTARSLPILAVLLATSGFYFTYCRPPADELLWVKRMDPRTGRVRSYNIRTKEMREDDGAVADTVRAKRGTVRAVTALLRDPFDRSKAPSRVNISTTHAGATSTTSTPSPTAGPQQQPNNEITTAQTAVATFIEKLENPSIQDMAEVVLFHRVLDILLRTKHLMRARDSASVSASAMGKGGGGGAEQISIVAKSAYSAAMVDLEQAAQSQLGVRVSTVDLERAVRNLELLVHAERVLQTTTLPAATADDDTTAAAVVSTSSNRSKIDDKRLQELQQIRSALRQKLLTVGSSSTTTTSANSTIDPVEELTATTFDAVLGEGWRLRKMDGGKGVTVSSGSALLEAQKAVPMQHFMSLILQHLPVVEQQLKEHVGYQIPLDDKVFSVSATPSAQQNTATTSGGAVSSGGAAATAGSGDGSSRSSDASQDAAAMLQELRGELYWERMGQSAKEAAKLVVGIAALFLALDGAAQSIFGGGGGGGEDGGGDDSSRSSDRRR